MIKAIVFDKDGTLLEFSDIWTRGCYKIFEKLKLSPDQIYTIKNQIGIGDDDVVIENSILAAGTISDLANVLSKYSDEVDLEKYIEDCFVETIDDNPSAVRPTTDLIKLFNFLENESIKIIVSTSDNLRVARKMFAILDLDNYIDYIIAADYFPAKPDTSSLDFIMDKYNLSTNDLIMVGDSRVDMQYAKDLRARIGVLCGTGTYQMLEKYADKLIADPIELINIINTI